MLCVSLCLLENLWVWMLFVFSCISKFTRTHNHREIKLKTWMGGATLIVFTQHQTRPKSLSSQWILSRFLIFTWMVWFCCCMMFSWKLHVQVLLNFDVFFKTFETRSWAYRQPTKTKCRFLTAVAASSSEMFRWNQTNVQTGIEKDFTLSHFWPITSCKIQKKVETAKKLFYVQILCKNHLISHFCLK